MNLAPELQPIGMHPVRINFSRHRLRRFAIPLCFGLMLQNLSGCADNRAPAAAVGQPFPLELLDRLPRLNGGAPNLEGRTLLINFWATWCQPCRREMPDLQQLSDTLDPGRFAIVGVAVDDDGHLVREFMLRHDIRFVNYLDVGRGFAARRLGIETFPQSFIVSPRGIVLRRIGTAISWDRFLGEKTLTPAATAAGERTSFNG